MSEARVLVLSINKARNERGLAIFNKYLFFFVIDCKEYYVTNLLIYYRMIERLLHFFPQTKFYYKAMI